MHEFQIMVIYIFLIHYNFQNSVIPKECANFNYHTTAEGQKILMMEFDKYYSQLMGLNFHLHHLEL